MQRESFSFLQTAAPMLTAASAKFFLATDNEPESPRVYTYCNTTARALLLSVYMSSPVGGRLLKQDRPTRESVVWPQPESSASERHVLRRTKRSIHVDSCLKCRRKSVNEYVLILKKGSTKKAV